MSSAKIWILITGVILMAATLMTYSTVKSKETEKAALMAKIQELNGKLAELSQVETNLAQLKKEKSELEAKLQSDTSALETQISEYKKTEASLRSKIDALTREKETMAKYMENSNLIVSKLQKKVEGLEKERKAALEKIKKTEESSSLSHFADPMEEVPEAGAKTETGVKLAGEEAVDLGRIIIRQSTNQPAQVEHVNMLYGFIVISAGTDDGLRKDSIINITRNNRLIAKAVIKKVRNNAASAATLPEWTREEIQVGDFISVNTPVLAQRR